jgi:hypothetical protein
MRLMLWPRSGRGGRRRRRRAAAAVAIAAGRPSPPTPQRGFGHAKDLGNLVEHGYIERLGDVKMVAEKGLRHVERAFIDGLGLQGE